MPLKEEFITYSSSEKGIYRASRGGSRILNEAEARGGQAWPRAFTVVYSRRNE